MPPVQITTITERHRDPKDIEMFAIEVRLFLTMNF